MLTFNPTMATMDHHALEVRRDGKVLGSIQWHSGSPPRFVHYCDIVGSITLNDLREIGEKLNECHVHAVYGKDG